MSVYTTISKQQLTSFIQAYNIGKLLTFSGISAGMENTNYAITTTQGEYILTLYEHYPAEQLGYYFDLMKHLKKANIKTLTPVSNRDGIILGSLANKPAALIHRLQGEALSTEKVTVAHCQIIGKALAQFHLAGQSFEQTRPNQRDSEFSLALIDKLNSHLSPQERQLLQQEMQSYQQSDWSILPSGTIHADLFCDNSIFYEEGGKPVLSGIIDLYTSADDAFIYDLAIVVNDWCCDAQGTLIPALWQAVIAAYHDIRPITIEEQNIWTAMLRFAALRFWIFRLDNTHFPPAGDLVKQKDPDELMHKIIACQRDEDTIMQQLSAAL